jgi:hypothetical protein
MYFNVFGKKVSRARYKEMVNARKNRQELIAAGLGRRDFIKMGLVTGAGCMIAKSGLSARAATPFPLVSRKSTSEALFGASSHYAYQAAGE